MLLVVVVDGGATESMVVRVWMTRGWVFCVVAVGDDSGLKLVGSWSTVGGEFGGGGGGWLIGSGGQQLWRWMWRLGFLIFFWDFLFLFFLIISDGFGGR